MSDRVEMLLEEVRGMFKALADGLAGNTQAIYELRDRADRVEARLDRVEVEVMALTHGQEELRLPRIQAEHREDSG